MSGTPVEQIKEKLDIAEFIRSYIPLTPAGKNFKANCPFHKEKTPSFMVSPERQSWHCFGCNLGGDAFAFLMRYENVEFGEALRMLAERTGIELRRMNPAEYKVAGLLYDLNEEAARYFAAELSRAGATKKYLAERGLAQGTIEEFGIGWAPQEPEGLTRHLMKQNADPQDIIRAGLALKTDRGMMLDRFRGRIMFPIHNHVGKIAGFSGRILPSLDTGDIGKYVNSPETPIFAKSKLLYGFWKTKTAIREAGFAFLVEGQMDMLMSYQAGVRNAVASSGTAFTADHLRALRKLTEELAISFDADEAGAEAAERAIDLAEASDFRVRVVRLEGYKDPADAAQAGKEVLQAALASAMPAPEFYIRKYLPEGSIDRKDRSYLSRLRAVLRKIVNLASPVDRSMWMAELARRFGIDERALMEEAERLRGGSGKSPEQKQKSDDAYAPERARTLTRRELLAERLLGIASARGDLGIIAASAEHLPQEYAEILALLERGERRSDSPDVDERLNMIMLRGSEAPGEEEISLLKAHLLEEYVRERRRELTRTIKSAEANGDERATAAASKELNELPMV